MALSDGTGLSGPKNKTFPVLRVPSCYYSVGDLFTGGIVCIAACGVPNYILLTTPEEMLKDLTARKQTAKR